MTDLIGLAGRAGSGKSTAARHLVEEYGATEFSFARALKLLAMDVFGFSHEQVFGTQAQKEATDPRFGFSAREALIRLGDCARRRLGADIWANITLDEIRRSGCGFAVISDVRYQNEAEAIRAAGGRVVKLFCPDADTKVDPNAPSERSVDEITALDAIIAERRSPGAEGLIHAIDDLAYLDFPLWFAREGGRY